MKGTGYRDNLDKGLQGKTGAMNIITVIHNLMGQTPPDQDVLRKVVIEVNKYLTEEDRFDLDSLPDTVSLLAMITLLPDASKYSLYMTQIDVTPKNNIRRTHQGEGVSKKDTKAGVMLGVLATIIALLSMTSSGEQGVDWHRFMEILLKVLEMMLTV